MNSKDEPNVEKESSFSKMIPTMRVSMAANLKKLKEKYHEKVII